MVSGRGRGIIEGGVLHPPPPPPNWGEAFAKAVGGGRFLGIFSGGNPGIFEFPLCVWARKSQLVRSRLLSFRSGNLNGAFHPALNDVPGRGGILHSPQFPSGITLPIDYLLGKRQ